ncbi:MAG TPA: DUF2071 domain-containing protein [Terracidiphilus sp.]|jgi:uncharacterized protein YqjF (DUF2071 family)|nr:DUF2071 domain-containing protein [Terracidiphilus sp.]
MQEIKWRTSQQPRPLPAGRWRMAQRWNDLLFAHWRVEPRQIAPLLPEGLVVDTFDRSAWLGVIPFWMDRIRLRGLPSIPGARRFPELNLRTYVRDLRTGTPGVFFLSLDGGNLLGALAARSLYHVPYHWARMRLEERSGRDFEFSSRRRLSRAPVVFNARYRGLGPTCRLAESRPGSLEYFLTERYCLFTRTASGQLACVNVFHAPWPLEQARAEIERNDLPAAAGIEIRAQDPVLYYARRLAVYMGSPELVAPARVHRHIPAQAMPSVWRPLPFPIK